jgi:uncharacterized protein
MRLSLVGFIITCLASTQALVAAEQKPLKVFFLTQSGSFEHSVVKRPAQDKLSLAEETMIKIGKDSGVFETRCSKDATLITPALLAETDVIMLYSQGDILGTNEPVTPKTPETEWQKKNEKLGITKDNWDAFYAWLKSGKALVGIHSATDTGKNFTPYRQLINGAFVSHPWTSKSTNTITNHEPTHPTVAMWEPEFSFTEEIYLHRDYDLTAVRLLMSLNMEKTKLKRAHFIPVAWVRDYGEGRMFYTNFGHNESTWKDERFHKHILEGVRWAAKITDGPSKPNPELQVELEKKSKEAGYIAGVKDLAKISGKDEAELIAAWNKAITKNASAKESLYGKIESVLNAGEKDKDKKEEMIKKAVEAVLAAAQ